MKYAIEVLGRSKKYHWDIIKKTSEWAEGQDRSKYMRFARGRHKEVCQAIRILKEHKGD